MKFLLIYTTHKNQEEAEKLIQPLIGERLIACVNYFPISSSYWWNGKIESNKEVVAILKTSVKNWEVLRDRIEEEHPYDTPCVINLAEAEANESYASWIEKETNI